MLVDSLGDIIITNDGVTILKEIDVEHPAAKMIIEVAKAQDNEVGDGTTTAVVLSGELLKRAEELLDQDIHPTIIANGYRMAAKKAMEVLEEIAIPVSKDDDEILKKIAATAMTGKGAEVALWKLAEIAVKAVKTVAEDVNGKMRVNPDYIKIEKRQGGAIEDTELVDGIVLDKEVVHPAMPKKVENAKILLLNSALEVKETEIDAKIRITDPEMMQKFIEQEEKMIKEMVDKIGRSLVILMQNHGVFAIGSSASQATKMAIEVEDIAKITYLAMLAGDPIILTKEQVAMTADLYARDYGQGNP